MSMTQREAVAELNEMYATGDYDEDSEEYQSLVRRVFGPLKELNLCQPCNYQAQMDLIEKGYIDITELEHPRGNCRPAE